MAFELNLRIGRNREERRSMPPEEEKIVEVRDKTAREQPVSVKSPEQAMRLSTAFRCTDILSGTIASLPLYIKRKEDAGNYKVDTENELHYLLTKKPNKRMNSYDLICNAIIQMVNRGNSYIFIKRMFGDTAELILCSNNSVTYDIYRDEYTICDVINKIYGTYPAESIIHLKNKSLDGGYTGVSTITYASTVLSVSASADNQSLRTFQNGSKIKGIISGVKGGGKGLSSVGDKQTSDVADRVEKDFNSGRDITSVSEDMTFTQLSITPADAQLLETKKFSVFDICRFYGVHPDKVFAGQSTNYKASEMSQVAFLSDTLDPILCHIEAEFNAKLIPRTVSGIYKIEFDRKALYKTDIATQTACMEKEIQYGVSTVNEWRVSREDKAPINGGDIAFMSCNVAPIDSPKIKGEISSEKDKLPKTNKKNIE